MGLRMVILLSMLGSLCVAQVDSFYIRMKMRGLNPYAPPPPPPGTPLPLSNPASDCPGAIRICQPVYNFAAAVPDFGNTQELLGGNNTCLRNGEHRSVWFIFTIQQGGTLGFIIDPGSSTDYDFALWDVTGLSNPCQAIGTPPIRCNYSASTSQNSCCGSYGGGPGITGIDHTNPQPGNLSYSAADPPVMPGLTVNAGQTFLLIVDNFNNNNQGYTITFTGTAQYFDNTPPHMDSISQACASNYFSQADNLRRLIIRFNELIDPATVEPNGSDFTVQDLTTNALIPVMSASPINPPQTDLIQLTLGAPLTPGQTYRIRIGYNPIGSGSNNGQPGSDGNTISDQCGIFLPTSNIPQGASSDSIDLVARDTITPTIAITSPRCVGSNTGQITASASGGLAPHAYALNTGSAATPPATGWLPNGSWSNLAAGTYTVWIRDAAGCIIRRVVFLNDPPALSVGVVDSIGVACGAPTGRVTFEGIGGTSPYEYSILPTAPAWQSSNTYSGLAPGNYTLRVRDANGCVATRSFTIQNAPALTLSVNITDSIRCHGGTGSFMIQASGGPSGNYTFTLQGAGIQNTTGIFSSLAAGNYTVFVQDGASCGLIDVTLTEPAPLALSDSTLLPITCRGGSDGQISLILTGGTLPYTVTWQDANGQTLPSTTPTISDLTEGTYTAFISDANGCTLPPRSYTLTFAHYVQIDSVSASLTADCPEKAYTFGVSVSGDGPFSYQWQWEDGSTEVAGATTIRRYPPQTAGRLQIGLRVEGMAGCYADTSFTIQADPCLGLNIPTVFTPNGDGINDVWTIQALGFRRYTIVVFDRWGQELFNNGGDLSKHWDGTKAGQLVTEGAYTFLFEGETVEGVKVQRSGTVTILR